MSALSAKVIQFPSGAKVRKTGRVYKKVDNTHGPADPIKDGQTMRRVLAELENSGKYGRRNAMIFKMGVVSGRRCGDILNLRRKDIWNETTNDVKSEIRYWDQKTKKMMSFFFSEAIRSSLREYMDAYDITDPGEYLFQSRKGKSVLDVRSYCRILRSVKQSLGLDMQLSTHTMRKTFGYTAFRAKGADFVTSALGHYSMKITARYLGIDREYLKQGYEDLKFDGITDSEKK